MPFLFWGRGDCHAALAMSKGGEEKWVFAGKEGERVDFFGRLRYNKDGEVIALLKLYDFHEIFTVICFRIYILGVLF